MTGDERLLAPDAVRDGLQPFDEDRLDIYLERWNRGRGSLYLLLLYLLAGAGVLLPLVELPHSARAQGIVRPLTPSLPLQAPLPAEVVEVRRRERESVRAGDTIVVLRFLPSRSCDLQLSRPAGPEADRLAAVVAAVHGRVERMTPLVPGSLLARQALIATITPEDDLVAEVYVSPADLVRLAVGAPALLTVTSRDARVRGRIMAIDDELRRTLGGSRGVLLVRALPVPGTQSEVWGRVKAGMRLTATFPGGRSTLWRRISSRYSPPVPHPRRRWFPAHPHAG